MYDLFNKQKTVCVASYISAICYSFFFFYTLSFMIRNTPCRWERDRRGHTGVHSSCSLKCPSPDFQETRPFCEQLSLYQVSVQFCQNVFTSLEHFDTGICILLFFFILENKGKYSKSDLKIKT